MKSGKRQMIEGIELPNQEKVRTPGEKEITSTREYWKRTPSNKRVWKKKIKKCITGELENYSKLSSAAKILTKW